MEIFFDKNPSSAQRQAGDLFPIHVHERQVEYDLITPWQHTHNQAERPDRVNPVAQAVLTLL